MDDNNYAWVCHGIIKGDWEKVRDKPGEWIKSKTGLSIVSQIVKYQPLPFMPCLIDGTNIKMVDLLRQFKTFLDNNGEEVLTFYLDNQNGISRDMIINAFNNSKIASYAHAQDTSKPWPTMRVDRPWVIGHSGEGIRPHAASAT